MVMDVNEYYISIPCIVYITTDVYVSREQSKLI